MQRKQTTSEIIPRVGLDHKVLIDYLWRHPELKPAERLPSGAFLWSEEEIQRLLDFRARRRRKQEG
jgi:hypothetical protein